LYLLGCAAWRAGGRGRYSSHPCLTVLLVTA